MTDLGVYVTTFNCGRAPVDVDYFAASLFHGFKSPLTPDLIVLSLQELAPLGYSFLGGSLLATFFARISTAFHDAVNHQFGRHARYTPVAIRNVGMTAIMVFAHQDTFEKIHSVDYAGIGVGVQRMGNKGAVGIRLTIRGGSADTLLTLVAAHLAPNESQCERRNQDWRDICEGLVFESASQAQQTHSRQDSNGRLEPTEDNQPLLETPIRDNDQPLETQGLFHPESHIIFAGDLNYRAADTSPSLDDPLSWPQPAHDPSHPNHHSKFFLRDQLTRERKAHRTLHHLDESPVTFLPTYKFSDAARQAAARRALVTTPHVLADGRQTTRTRLRLASTPDPDDDDAQTPWAAHRVPSWCDRILFSASSRPRVEFYSALPLQPTSDHRPVAALVVFERGAPRESVTPPFAIRADWRPRRAAARRSEYVVGAAAYLGLTWEGEMLLAGTIVGILGGFWILKALLAAN